MTPPLPLDPRQFTFQNIFSPSPSLLHKKLKCLKTKMHKTLKFWHYKALKNCIKNCIKNALPPAPHPKHFVIGLKFRVQLTVNLQTIEHVFSRWVLQIFLKIGSLDRYHRWVRQIGSKDRFYIQVLYRFYIQVLQISSKDRFYRQVLQIGSIDIGSIDKF